MVGVAVHINPLEALLRQFSFCGMPEPDPPGHDTRSPLRGFFALHALSYLLSGDIENRIRDPQKNRNLYEDYVKEIWLSGRISGNIGHQKPPAGLAEMRSPLPPDQPRIFAGLHTNTFFLAFMAAVAAG
jgi:hypothetical protein